MRIGMTELLMIFFAFILPALVIVGIFCGIKYLIKYNAKQKRIHSEQSEIERMKIDDLE